MKHFILIFEFLFCLIIASCAMKPVLPGRLLDATREQFPFQAIVSPSMGDDYSCGGILIADNAVIAPATCVYGAENVTVYLGLNQWPVDDEEEEDIQIYTVTADTDIIIHERYWPDNSGHNLYDIALIKLPQPIKKNEYIRPGELLGYEPSVHEYVVISGWLRQNNGLKTQRVFPRAGATCRKIFGTDFVGYREICAKTSDYSDFLLGSTVTFENNIVGFVQEASKPKLRHYVIFNISPYEEWIGDKIRVAEESEESDTTEIEAPEAQEERPEKKILDFFKQEFNKLSEQTETEINKIEDRLNILEKQLEKVNTLSNYTESLKDVLDKIVDNIETKTQTELI